MPSVHLSGTGGRDDRIDQQHLWNEEHSDHATHLYSVDSGVLHLSLLASTAL